MALTTSGLSCHLVTWSPCHPQVNCLVAGTGCAAVAKEVASVAGVSKVGAEATLKSLQEANPQVLLADSPAYTGFLPEHLTPLLVSAQNQFKYTHIVAVGRSHSYTYMYDFAYFSFNLLHNISMEPFSGCLRLLPLSVAPLGRPARRLSHL